MATRDLVDYARDIASHLRLQQTPKRAGKWGGGKYLAAEWQDGLILVVFYDANGRGVESFTL